MTMLIDNEYNLGDIVYLATDPDQLPRMVTAFGVRKQGSMLYELSLGEMSSSHQDFEITKERKVIYDGGQSYPT